MDFLTVSRVKISILTAEFTAFFDAFFVRFCRLANAELWKEFFESLLNIPSCCNLPSLGVLRQKLRDLFCSSYAKDIKLLRNRLVVLLIEHKRSRK